MCLKMFYRLELAARCARLTRFAFFGMIDFTYRVTSLHTVGCAGGLCSAAVLEGALRLPGIITGCIPLPVQREATTAGAR